MSEIAVRTQAQPLPQLSNDQLKYIANTDFIPKAMRGNLPAILACVATGRALGLADMEALRSIHIVDGKATFSAELMVNLTRRAGHSITAEYGDGQVTVHGKRGDNGDEISVTWTIAMAERADLNGKMNWRKYPEAMLWARAVSQLCRMLFADVFAGQTYTADEAELTDEEKVNEAIGEVKPPADEHEGPDDSVPAVEAVVVEEGEQATLDAIEEHLDAKPEPESFQEQADRAQAARAGQ